MRRVIFALCVVALLGSISCHSWIDCTDYSEVTKANGNYDANACKSRPRNWKNHNGGGVFGADTGYNFQGSTPDQCLYPLKAGIDVSSFYTTQYPMASYRLGQKVCLAWPAKNHAASRQCTNQFIPDTSNRIYISGANPTADPTGWTLLEDWGANPKGVAIEDNGGGQGFQNCPNFCAGTDKALCGRCFTIPTNLAPGRYAFQWRWVFNEGTAPYTTCWDANVVAGSGPAPAPAPPAPAPGPTTSSTGTPVTTQRPLSGDAVRIPNPPTNLQIGAATIPLTVEYSASSTVDIVVDFMSADYQSWYGKAIQKNVPAGKGTLQMSITVEKNPPAGDKVIKPWIVVAGNGEASQGWAYELDNKQYVTSYTSNPPQSQTPLSTVTPSSANKVVAATGFFTVVVLILSIFINAV